MADRKTNIASKVRNAVSEIIADAGYTLWDVAYYKEGPEMILEVSIDKEDGISINDCSVVTRLIEPIIDELDPIEESYCLQVASAGTVRPLGKEEHLRFAVDNQLNVTVGLYVAVDGSKEFCGVIEDFDDEGIVLSCGDEKRRFTHKQISKINAEFETQVSDEEENKEKEDE
jgi:ribosome maturation factor RimP